MDESKEIGRRELITVNPPADALTKQPVTVPILAMTVDNAGGMVDLKFNRPVEGITLTRQMARHLARLLMKNANLARVSTRGKGRRRKRRKGEKGGDETETVPVL